MTVGKTAQLNVLPVSDTAAGVVPKVTTVGYVLTVAESGSQAEWAPAGTGGTGESAPFPTLGTPASPVHVNDGATGTVITVTDVPENAGFFCSFVFVAGESDGPGAQCTVTLQITDNGAEIVPPIKPPVESSTPGANAEAFFGDQELVAWSGCRAWKTAVTGPLRFRLTPTGAGLDVESISMVRIDWIPVP